MAGKTVDEATEHALEQLGVAATDAEVVVLTEPKVGLFGRLKEEARVQARVRPVGARPKRERSRDRGRRSAQSGQRPSRSPRTSSGERGPDAQSSGPNGAGAGAGAGADSVDETDDMGWPPDEAGIGAGAARSGSSGRRRNRVRAEHLVGWIGYWHEPVCSPTTQPGPFLVRGRGRPERVEGSGFRNGGPGRRRGSKDRTHRTEGDGRHGRRNDARGAG